MYLEFQSTRSLVGIGSPFIVILPSFNLYPIYSVWTLDGYVVSIFLYHFKPANLAISVALLAMVLSMLLVF